MDTYQQCPRKPLSYTFVPCAAPKLIFFQSSNLMCLVFACFNVSLNPRATWITNNYCYCVRTYYLYMPAGTHSGSMQICSQVYPIQTFDCSTPKPKWKDFFLVCKCPFFNIMLTESYIQYSVLLPDIFAAYWSVDKGAQQITSCLNNVC